MKKQHSSVQEDEDFEDEDDLEIQEDKDDSVNNDDTTSEKNEKNDDATKSLKEMLDEYKAKLDKCKSEFAGHDVKLQDYEGNIQKRDSIITQLRQEKQKKEDECTRLEQEKKLINQRLEECRNEKPDGKLRDKLREKQEEIQTLERTIKDCKDVGPAELIDKNKEINEKLTKLERDEKNLKDQLKQIEQAKELVNTELEECRNEKPDGKLRDKLREKEEEIQTLERTIKDCKDVGPAELIDKNKEINEKLTDLERDKKILDDRLEQIDDEKGYINKDMEAKLNKNIESLQEEIQVLKNRKTNCKNIEELLDIERERNLDLAKKIDRLASKKTK